MRIQCKFLTETLELTNDNIDACREANRLQLPSGQEPFACIHYNPSDNEYTKKPFDEDQEFIINMPVAYYSAPDGEYKGMLTKFDKVNIKSVNNNVAGQKMPWCKYADSVTTNGKVEYNVFVSTGLEWGSMGSDRAWID